MLLAKRILTKYNQKQDYKFGEIRESMNRIWFVILAALMLFSACKSDKKGTEPKESGEVQSTPVQNMEVTADESEPFLTEGESLYENWAYTFIDADGNGVAERVSFTNIERDKSIISRIAVEFDFVNNTGGKSPVYIERKGGLVVHPEIQCANVSDGTLIIVKDLYAVSGEELYPFMYTVGGALSEFNMGSSTHFPENAMSRSDVLNMDKLDVKAVSQTELAIKKDSATFMFSPKIAESEVLCDKYTFIPDGKENIMAFEPESKTVIYGITGKLTGSVSGSAHEQVIYVKVLVTLRYDTGTFGIRDISFM